MSKSSALAELEVQELIQVLIANGHKDLVDTLLLNENKVYTKKGRLNKSGACRQLGWKPKQLEEELEKCKELLRNSVES